MKSWKKPTPEQVKKAALALGRPESAFYFFNKLTNPLWIDPLRDLGFFQHPPPELREGDRLSFPLWPAARYLVRMASEGEDVARNAIQTILKGDPTENHLVHLSYVELALAAPAGLALNLVRQERQWLAKQSWLYALLPEKFAELAVHMIKSGHADEAFKLAGTLLGFLAEGSEAAGARDEPTARFDKWNYEQLLKRIVPAFQQADMLGTVSLVCNLLFDCAKRLGEDASYGWRPAVEESEQNWDLDRIPDLLVDTVRDTCEAAIRAEPAAFERVLDELVKREKLGIFRRVRLHLLRTFRDVAGARARVALLDTSQMDSLEVTHEYVLLMRDGFADLNQAEKDVLLAAIVAGPRTYRPGLSDPERRPELERYSRVWKRDRLAIIHDKLQPDWAAVYGSLVDELGPPAHPEFGAYHSTKFWHGPESPKTAQELAAMSLDALVEYLVVWRPTRDFMAPSPEGLGRALEEVAAGDPERLLAGADKLHRLHPVYVRSIVAGVAKALSQGKRIDWRSALSQAIWSVGQVRLPYTLPGDFTDKDWTWTRKSVIDLLSAGMKSKSEFPIEARTQVWEALRPTLDDPEPTPASEDLDSQNFEPGTVALNTVRGSAFHALIAFALWIRRWQERQPDAANRVAAGFAELPEVRDALEAHLDPARDPSLAVRSVYGQWFPWLVMLDKAWARAAVPRIFPADRAGTDLLDSAWQAYLAHNQPYRDVTRVLHEEYVNAADRLGGARKIRVRALRPAEQALGEHLLVMYARGWIERDDPALASFFAHAEVETRVTVLGSVGRNLMARGEEERGAKPHVAPEVLTRLQELWDSRLQAAGRDKRESEAFGWWFATGAFDTEWSWKRLVAAVMDAGRVDGQLFLARRLAVASADSPRDAVFVLETLISNTAKPWTIFELKDAIGAVLVAALGADEGTKETAIRLINRLGERGFGEYRDLLPRP